MNHTGTSGRLYVTGRLSLPTALMVSRKVGAMMPVVQPLVAKANAGKDKTLLVLMLMGNLSDEAANAVTTACMGVVSSADIEGKYVRVMGPQGGYMFEDISVQDIYALTGKVIEENLGDFFLTALGSLDAEATTANPS